MNQNLHVTNICKNLCGFCGFGRKATDPGAYCHDKDGIQAQARLAYERNVRDLPPLRGPSGVHHRYFRGLIHWVHEAAPESISMLSARTKWPLRQKSCTVPLLTCLPLAERGGARDHPGHGSGDPRGFCEGSDLPPQGTYC